MTSTKRLFANELYLKKFRSFNEVRIPLGRKMTVISGVNGVGKSNIISLISSGSGVSRKSALGSNFQPEFSENLLWQSGFPSKTIPRLTGA